MTDKATLLALAEKHDKQAIKEADEALWPSNEVWAPSMRLKAIQHFTIAASLRAIAQMEPTP